MLDGPTPSFTWQRTSETGSELSVTVLSNPILVKATFQL
jgi:hypothetical protein